MAGLLKFYHNIVDLQANTDRVLKFGYTNGQGYLNFITIVWICKPIRTGLLKFGSNDVNPQTDMTSLLQFYHNCVDLQSNMGRVAKV